MDGFDRLSKTKMWADLKRAESALFDAQRAFERSGFSSDWVYAARLELGKAENQLRQYFKSTPRPTCCYKHGNLLGYDDKGLCAGQYEERT